MKRILSVDVVILLLCSLLLVSAPWVRAGNLAAPTMLLELIGASIFLLVFYNGKQRGKISLSLWLIILAICLIPLVYLAPIPFDVWANLPGREGYVSVVTWISNDANFTMPNTFPLSIAPSQTVDAALVLIPLISLFIATLTLNYKQLMFVVFVFVGVVFLQALIGLVQSMSGDFYIFYEQNPTGRAQGSYPTSDHFSAFMVMGLFIIFSLLESKRRILKDRSEENGVEAFISMAFLFYLSCTVFVFISVIYSGSRAGIFLMFLGVGAIWLIGYKYSAISKYFLGGVFGAALVNIVLWNKQIIPVINRFIAVDPTTDARSDIFSNTVVAIKTFFPFGSGVGTFPSIYPRFQSLSQAKSFVNNAHNDYLELFFETGLLGFLVLLLFLTSYVARWKVLLFSQQRINALLILQLGAGVSTLMFLLHALLDFNFHIFANMIYFSFLLAIFYSRVDETLKSDI